MEGDFIKINEWLTPLSWCYGLGVSIRNLLFDMGLRKSRSFKTPVITVGNITVGGTGKTPHVEYLVRLLQDELHVAVLSRGYKRRSKGFLVADEHTTTYDVGDEPFQMKKKFPGVTVAVDRQRVHGILQLTNGDNRKSDVDVVVLDDAFQHRQVKPGINILLVDYHRLITYDRLLPAGRLREPLAAKNRADIVIVTKCPKDLKPMEYRVVTKALNLFPYQQLYFSTLEYDGLKGLYPEAKAAPAITMSQHTQQSTPASSSLASTNVLLLAGIASPRQMIEDLTPLAKSLTPLTFSDHHDFSARDVRRINTAFEALPKPRLIITTEKDGARLTCIEGLSDEVRRHLYVLPIHIRFLLDQQKDFDNGILEYIQKSSRPHLLSILKEKKRKLSDKNTPSAADKTITPPPTIKF